MELNLERENSSFPNGEGWVGVEGEEEEIPGRGNRVDLAAR